jgi:hypothetical protein
MLSRESSWRAGLLCLPLLSSACAAERGAGTPAATRVPLDVPRPPTPRHEERAAGVSKPAEPCAVAKAITDASIARAEQHAKLVMERLTNTGAYTGPKHAGAIDSYVLSDWLECFETPGGAWATVLVKAQLAPTAAENWSEFHLDGTIALVHVDRTGAISQVEISTEAGASETSGEFFNRELFAPGLPNCCSFVFGGLARPGLYDFDADGEPEIHIAASYGHEGAHDEWDALFTFRAGRIERYAPAQGYPFLDVRDETGDGVPDLVMAEELPGGESCGSGFPANGRGLALIAHALPGGTFSAVDAAARDYAKKQCPAAPASIQSFSDVLCARLWGRSKDELERVVRTSFVAWDCAAETAQRPQNPRARADYELMLSATKSDVPFTLR